MAQLRNEKKLVVSFRLHGEQVSIFREFCRDVGLTAGPAAKQALFYSINHAYQTAEKLMEMQANAVGTGSESANEQSAGSLDVIRSRNTEGDSSETQNSETVASDVSSPTETDGNPS